MKDPILKVEQKKSAMAWYRQHESHIKKLIKGLDVGYAPSNEDKSFPHLWKPTHWFWFIYNYFG